MVCLLLLENFTSRTLRFDLTTEALALCSNIVDAKVSVARSPTFSTVRRRRLLTADQRIPELAYFLRMVVASSLQLSNDFGIHTNYGLASQPKCRMGKGRLHFITMTLSSTGVFKDAWKLHSSSRINKPRILVSSKCGVFLCQSVLLPSGGNDFPVMEKTAMVLKRMCSSLSGINLILHLVPAISILAFAAWGLGPLMSLSFNLFPNKTEASWKKSSAYHLMTSYVQPLLLCTGAMLICRSLDPIILPSEASQAVKQRLLRFVQSLSIVLAFAYCLSSLIQHAQKFFMETSDTSDARNLGFQFAGKAVYTAVWIAAISLFMELLGFSTQKWLTAGGLGTVLLTLAGREIFTNFLSSVMIHTTRPFVLNDWIQTKIEGYEVSGTVEHVGWWSPTIIRGDDREAVHIPNHKFTVNVVRNLSQKTHWRIKTHLAVSHLDAGKINNIVADMRKVLAKIPQVEQQKLHRRVFLDNINPENQALLIMVSCFVKTSHFEEYLCVKEAIVLDLLRVINHHRARLATPLRTIQKVYAGVDVESTPISETIFTQSTAAASRPFLLIDPSYKLSGDDKTNSSSRWVRSNEDKEKSNPATKTDSKFSAASSNASISPASASDDSVKDSLGKHQNKKADVDEAAVSERDLKDITTESSFKKPPPLSSESGSERVDGPSLGSPFKQDGERPVSLATTPTLEENILLGVALEGSKRTLPIEEAIDPSPAESKELASCRNGNGSPPVAKDKDDDQIPTSSGSGSGSASSDQQEKESL